MPITTNVHNSIQDLYKVVEPSAQEWCGNLDFEFSGNDYDYNNYFGQKFYLLKYYPAYLCDYYHQFKRAIKRCRPGKINVISIGCGAGIDYLGLNLALNDTILNDNYRLNSYIGIDPIDWDDRPSEINYSNCCISTFDTTIVAPLDIIIFPRSLTDISEEKLKIFADNLNISSSNKITIIASYITSDASNPELTFGHTKYNCIHDSLIKNNWTTSDDHQKYYHFKNLNDGYRSLFPTVFDYPNGVYQFLGNIKTTCKQVNNKSECELCDPKSIPMMRMKYSAWKIMTYVREQS